MNKKRVGYLHLCVGVHGGLDPALHVEHGGHVAEGQGRLEVGWAQNPATDLERAHLALCGDERVCVSVRGGGGGGGPGGTPVQWVW